MRPLRLSRLLFVRSLLAAVATFVTVYPLVILWLMPQADREIEHRQLLLGRAIVEQVQAHLAGPAFTLEGMARALDTGRRSDPAFVYAMLDSFLEHPGSFSSLYLIDDGGRVIAAGLPPARRGMRADLVGLDLSAHPLWRAAHESAGLIWTDAFLSTVEGGFTVAAARRSGGHTLIGELAFDPLFGRLSGAEPSENGLRILLLDRRGRTLSDSRGELRARQQDFGQHEFIRHPARFTGQVVYFDFEGEAMLGTVATVPDLNWRVLVMRPEAEAYRPVHIANVILVGGLVAAILIALLGAAVQARYFGRQFRRLSAFAGAVGEGRYEMAWNPSRVTELNELAASFERMSQSIRAREQELAASQVAYRELVESTTELVVRLDADWRLTYANPAVCRLLGAEEADLTGRPLGRWLCFDDESWQRDLFAELSAGADSVQFECPMQDNTGKTHRVAWTLHTGRDDSGARRYGAIGRDISDRWEAGEALRRSEERLRATLDAATTVAIQWYDAQGRVLYWNPGSALLYGYRPDEALGRTVESLGLFDAEVLCAFHAMLERLDADGATEGPMELAVRTRGGEQRHTLMTSFSIPAREGGRYFVSMDIDITDRREAAERLRELNETLEARVAERTADLHRSNEELGAALAELQRAQEELLRAEKMAALGALVAGVAHELGTPLGNSLMAANTVADHTRALRRELEGGLRRSTLDQYLADTESGTHIIERNLERASELVTSFRQVAVDQSSSQRRAFLLDEVVEEIALTLRPSFKHQPWTFETEVESGLRLDSYPGPLGQVIANLVTNATVHAFEGRADGTVKVSGRADGDGAVIIEVRDDGRGIPAEMQRRIFDPFFTTRMGQGGSGLGLHIVQNLVSNLLGGTVVVDSRPGGGTCMRVRIPREAPHPKRDEAESPPQAMV
ncbi:PAS domain S-box protein [Pseudothauera nasutitermitis]|uniref:histidine kinase n=1 Tax=Pseudothauera nasutitermitis TaxID=2565930 RepID=A0A4S4AUN8_9RHOO|nr:PAS domain S-box protein [Pseudothauera nasutitermitis]THF63679.1 PAS domain S-box protein [Pseudothauera nasutitermitis]